MPELLEERRKDHLEAFTTTEELKSRAIINREGTLVSLLEARVKEDRLQLAGLGELPSTEEESVREGIAAKRELQLREATLVAEKEALSFVEAKARGLESEVQEARGRHSQVERKHSQIQTYKNQKAKNEADIRDLIIENRSMVKRFRTELELLTQGRNRLISHASAVPSHAAQLQDGPSTELSYFLRLPLNVLLRTPDHQIVSELTLNRLRGRCNVLQKRLSALGLQPYEAAPCVAERVVELKTELAKRDTDLVADQASSQKEIEGLGRHQKAFEKEIFPAVGMTEQKLKQLEGTLKQAIDAALKDYPKRLQKVAERLEDFETQPGQFAADRIHKVGGLGVGDWLLRWDEKVQRSMVNEAA